MKERVIGAVVLVVIAVLVVPVFLDGPSTDAGMVSEPVTLPGQNGQPRTRKTIVLERDRDQPVPASAGQREPRPADDKAPEPAEQVATADVKPEAAGTKAAIPDEQPEKEPERRLEKEPEPSQVEKEEDPPEPAPAAEPAKESATGMWAVQMGSFSNKANADRLAARLRETGYAAFLSQLKTDSGELHRVRVGPQKDRESAETVAAQLRADGMGGQVVPHP